MSEQKVRYALKNTPSQTVCRKKLVIIIKFLEAVLNLSMQGTSVNVFILKYKIEIFL